VKRRDPSPDLPERVDRLEAECDAYLDDVAAEISANCPGVPQGVIRQTMMHSNNVFIEARRIKREREAQQ
jgi:hypothetical protein